MSFKTRKIRKKPPFRFRLFSERSLLSKVKHLYSSFITKQKGPSTPFRYLWLGSLTLFALWIVIKVTLGAYHLVVDFKGTAKEVVFKAASELKTDENGYTNIVLLGDGGNRHDGVGLMDTIMVASIDYKKNAVTLLSIPRDYYVGPSEGVGIGKINEVYLAHKEDSSEKGGYAAYQDVLGEITGLEFHYYIRVDFNAFVEIVDSLGGITVNVPRPIYDPEYPNESETGESLFKLNAGIQQMDGKTALKFARSRKTTSDYDRAARQQLILGALQQKAFSAGVLANPAVLKDVYDAIESNMSTNMSWRELLALGKFANDFDRSHLVMKVLSTQSGTDGGFLYDGDRSVYGGAVVLPDGGDLDLIHRYADLIFHHREMYFDPPKIQILNATKTSGLAGKAKYKLAPFGFNVVDVGNYLGSDGEKQYVDESMLMYYSWVEEEGRVTPTYALAIEVLSDFVPFVSLPGKLDDLEQDVDLTLVLGADYREILSE